MDEKEMANGLRKILIFTVCIGIGLAAAGIGFIQIFLVTFHQETKEKMEREVENYAKRINKQVSQNFQMLNTLASVIGDSIVYDSDLFDDTLTDACEKNSFITIGFFDVNEIGTIASENEKIEKNVKTASLQNEAREVIKHALEGKEAASHTFYSDFSHERVFMFGVPVYNDRQEIVGALIANDLAEVFSEIIGSEKILDGNAHIHLVDSDGHFLIRSSHAVVEEEKHSIFEEPYMKGNDIQRVQDAMKHSQQALFQFDYNGKTYHSLLEPLGFKGWSLLCINSVQNSNRRIYTIAKLFIAFYVVIVLLVGFILFYGYRFMRRSNQKLMEIAYLDPLTGIYNFRRFRELAGKRVENHPDCSIAILNVRRFKFINEIFGKEQADRLLEYIAQILQKRIYEEEYVCRDSADFFYIYMDETDPQIIKSRLQAIIDEIVQTPGQSNDEYHLKLHCGVAISTEELPIQKILTRAMFALIKSKENYKESIWIFDSQLHEHEKMDNYVESHMHEALEKEHFKVYLQPQINLKDNTLIGAEALVRWIEDDGRIIFPSQFIPLFEENGFCAQLDLYMVRKACQLLRQWIDAGYRPVPISINQSKLVFYENHYTEKLCAILDEYNIPATLITLEILEEMVIENLEELNERLEKLQEIGFKISMDDFGSGYSSLNTLGKIKINELKLDRGFLKEVNDPKNANSRLVLEQIVQLSKKMSVSTVVEGVETAEDDALVKEIGCDYGQGYYYGRPVGSEEFTAEVLGKV